MHRTDDLRISTIKPLTTPEELLGEFPLSEAAGATVARARRAVSDILHGRDERLLIVVGPCSIHDPEAALEYADRLAEQRCKLRGRLEVLMRVYFEKPRTTIGWKGLINDPGLDGSFRINEGLRTARKLLLDINEMGVPTACEFLDTITPQYIGDLVGWGAIGARTTESQVHRELASGLSCPVGFKNGTDGNVKIAVDAVQAAGIAHHFLGTTKDGRCAIVATEGNRDSHVILRGGHRPNYDTHTVRETCDLLGQRGLPARLMVDASHANSGKDPMRQLDVCREIGMRRRNGEGSVIGLMVESNLVEGRQDLVPERPLVYGQSITDGCIGWEDTVRLLHEMASAGTGKLEMVGA